MDMTAEVWKPGLILQQRNTAERFNAGKLCDLPATLAAQRSPAAAGLTAMWTDSPAGAVGGGPTHVGFGVGPGGTLGASSVLAR